MTPDQPSAITMLVPYIAVFGILYLMMFRPQQQKAKQHVKFLETLKRGDEVVTASGIFGRIEGMTEKVITLEIANGVRMQILRKQIAGSKEAFLADAKPSGSAAAKKA